MPTEYSEPSADCARTLSEIEIEAQEIRETLKGTNKLLWDFVEKCKKTDELTGASKGEAIANSMLAYRHAEDSRMRLGKVCQAAQEIPAYDA